MTPRLSHILIGVAFVIGLLGLVVFGLDAYHKRSGTQAEHNAAVASGEAITHEQSAQAQNPAIQKLEAQHAKDAADVDRLSKERDALLRRVAALRQSNPHPAGDNPSPVQPLGPNDSELSGNSGELDLLRATVEKDAEVIESQDLLIKNQSEQILVITKRADEWEAACHARERQAQAQQAATDAWKSAVTSSRWRGRIEGFAAGVALGYVGGRR